MIKRLLTLGLFLVFGLLVFNYFWGTEEDKENVRNITQGIKNLYDSTKDKYEKGQYDNALKKMGDVFSKLKDVVKEKGGEFEDRLKTLEERKEVLEEQLDKLDAIQNQKGLVAVDNTEKEREVKQELSDLIKEIDELTTDLDK